MIPKKILGILKSSALLCLVLLIFTCREMTEITGLFEIHITVHPDDLFKLRMYCMDFDLKPILAVAEYGDHPIQPMFSKFKNGKMTEVVERAKTMAKCMKEEYGIRVTRVKVESMMSNEGVPNTAEDMDLAAHSNYFEFHVKVKVADSKQWKTLSDLCRTANAHLSFNAFKKETIPLITLRVYHTFRQDAIRKKDALMELLKKNDFHTNFGIQSEYSVYDDNVQLDLNWVHYQDKEFDLH